MVSGVAVCLSSVSLTLSLGWISACSPQHVAELFLLRHDFHLTRDLAYGSDPRQHLDVYQPRTSQTAAPVVVFLYGGRWQHGSKNEYHLLGEAFTRQGLVAVVPDYRLYPQVRFPEWVDDAASVVRWARDNVQRYGGDSTRILVVGHSSGAHTTALLALDHQYLRRAGVPPGVVRGFISLAGPVATEWTDSDVQALMGPPGGWPATYPMAQVDGKAPPLLLLHGARDKTVDPANSVQLATRIRSHGGCSRVVVYKGLDHVGIVIALALPTISIAAVMDEVMKFVRNPIADSCDPPGPPR
jgi:acetyl esterase/lipase